jgi:hypothetical protein
MSLAAIIRRLNHREDTMMSKTHVLRVGLIAAFLVTGGAPYVAAQTATNPEFARLREQLKAGDRLTVRLSDGSAVSGKFAEVGPESLSFTTDSGTRRVAADDVVRVQRTRRSYLLGTIIGAGVGIACGAALATLAENEGGNYAPAIAVAGAGAGIGLGIDALVNFPHTVYKRPAPRTALRIDARPARVAIGATLSF